MKHNDAQGKMAYVQQHWAAARIMNSNEQNADMQEARGNTAVWLVISKHST